MIRRCLGFAALALLAGVFLHGAEAPAADGGAQSEMKFVPSGVMQTIGVYIASRLALSPATPAPPRDPGSPAAPRYGATLNFGEKKYLFALDAPAGAAPRLFVDANANGDLSDDQALAWDAPGAQTAAGPDQVFRGSIKLPIQTPEGPKPATLGVYVFSSMPGTLFYYPDYGMVGTVTLGGEKHVAILSDTTATGDFASTATMSVLGRRPGTTLWIDLNDDGRFDPRYEVHEADEPFNIKGSTWELAGLTKSGSFKIVASRRIAEEIVIPANLAPGQKPPAFDAVQMDGKTVHFPADYKGKVVMIDFWATWCGPCMAEIPNVVKIYNAFHSRGFEILGVSLDHPDSADRIKSTAGQEGMTWPQIYEGKFWDTKIGRLYGIDGIPHAVLIDGDTGLIIADGNALRGDGLGQTLKDVFEARRAKTAR